MPGDARGIWPRSASRTRQPTVKAPSHFDRFSKSRVLTPRRRFSGANRNVDKPTRLASVA